MNEEGILQESERKEHMSDQTLTSTTCFTANMKGTRRTYLYIFILNNDMNYLSNKTRVIIAGKCQVFHPLEW